MSTRIDCHNAVLRIDTTQVLTATRLTTVGEGRLYLLDLRDRMKQVIFYHSAICPRCFITRRFVNQLIREYPGIEIESVEFLTSRQRAKK